MLPSHAEEKRRKDRISKRLSSKSSRAILITYLANVDSGERQRKQKQRDEEIQEFLDAFEPHLIPDFGWEGSQLSESPTYHYGALPRSELADVRVSSHHDDFYTKLGLMRAGSDGSNSFMGGSITSGSSELNESPASADIAYSFGEIGPHYPADYSTAPSNCPFSTSVSAARCMSISKTNSAHPILQTKPQTTLHRAIVTGNVKIVQLLLRHGAIVDAQDPEGMTPLHLAVHCRNRVLVTLLLQCNADLEARDAQGRRAVDFAVEAEDFSIVELLISHGTSIK